MGNYEEQIRKERTFEATRKNFMGKSGHFGAIAMIIGSPIISEGAQTHSGSWENAIPYMDDSYSYLRGWVWEGLREGLHLEIKIEGYCEDINRPDKFMLEEIKVNFKGYPVYHEKNGRLELYTPMHPVVGEWEQNILKLYDRAMKIRKRNMKFKESEEKAASKNLANKLLDMLRFKWGD